jgi:hypothetical protein
MWDRKAIFLLTLILALDIDIGCQLYAPALCSQGSPRSPSNRNLGRSQDRDGKYGEEKHSSFQLGIKGFLDRSARNQFTTVTELSILTSAKENMQVKFYDKEFLSVQQNVVFGIKICEDFHHHKK